MSIRDFSTHSITPEEIQKLLDEVKSKSLIEPSWIGCDFGKNEKGELSMKEYDDLDKLIDDMDKERDEFNPLWLLGAVVASWVIVGGIIWLIYLVWSSMQ